MALARDLSDLPKAEDDDLRRHIAGCCGFVSARILTAVTS